MTRNSASTIAHDYHEGMDVVCMWDHQMHDKLNYLDRYKVLSVETDVLGLRLVEITARNHKNEKFPAEWFVPLWYFEGKDNPMTGNRVTQEDVAKLAGTEQPNVSAILNGKTSTYSESLIRKVQESAKQLGYRLRMDEKAMADPQPVVKRTELEHHKGGVEAVAVKQAQQFENVPDMTIAANWPGSPVPDTFPIADVEKFGKVVKADQGKIDMLCFDQDFPHAQEVIAQVFNYGLQKYARGDWKHVHFDRWDAAQRRHQRDRDKGVIRDHESGLLHLAHEIAGKIVMLQKYILDHPGENFTKFNPPPQDHKKHG